ncbi:MAG: PspC domain-containing protein [Bacteroidales bacterium]|nr:PspC domain-containing protein [Bacteroidales bacterium]
MKKTIRIHISGYIFNIDEDAYQKLKIWLDSISEKYKNEEDGEEIFNDIEMRVAELFEEKSGHEGVVTQKEVDDIIKIMGKPEDFEPEEDENINFSFSNKKKSRKQKRLYRDEENQIIAGVCSGLGSYFGIDPVIIRLLFVAALVIGGFGTLLYIILWIAVPKAETISQKLEMNGEPVTVSNIEKAIRDEFETGKKKLFKKKKN